jgi:hypothetical protein
MFEKHVDMEIERGFRQGRILWPSRSRLKTHCSEDSEDCQTLSPSHWQEQESERKSRTCRFPDCSTSQWKKFLAPFVVTWAENGCRQTL